jgi:hypothetical protein
MNSWGRAAIPARLQELCTNMPRKSAPRIQRESRRIQRESRRASARVAEGFSASRGVLQRSFPSIGAGGRRTGRQRPVSERLSQSSGITPAIGSADRDWGPVTGGSTSPRLPNCRSYAPGGPASSDGGWPGKVPGAPNPTSGGSSEPPQSPASRRAARGITPAIATQTGKLPRNWRADSASPARLQELCAGGSILAVRTHKGEHDRDEDSQEGALSR